MLVEKFNLNERSIQTTVTFPLRLYVQLVEKAQAEKISLSEIVRRAVFKEFEPAENKSTKPLER